jgi:hypothetical protein
MLAPASGSASTQKLEAFDYSKIRYLLIILHSDTTQNSVIIALQREYKVLKNSENVL